MAKIKYPSQFIKQKQVKTIECKDISPPNSDDEEVEVIRVQPVNDKIKASNLKGQKVGKELKNSEVSIRTMKSQAV